MSRLDLSHTLGVDSKGHETILALSDDKQPVTIT